MKSTIFLVFLLASVTASAQGDSMYVSGRFLYNHCGEKVILRGVNYPVLDDWDFPANMNNGNERLKEIEKTGANCVRIEWFNNYGDPRRSTYSLKDLDSLLTRCARFKMIPIVGLWDLTTTNDWEGFPQTITAWWTQPAVVQLIKKHQRYLIINLANEMGKYFWTNFSQADLAKYESNYKTCIASVRNAGIHVPLMIDATDGASRLDVLRSKGPALINSDPLKNILLDVHTYWIIYPTPNPPPAQILNEFQLAADANLPVVIGEVANYQSESGDLCTYNLSAIYPEVLKAAKQFDIGWMAWCWCRGLRVPSRAAGPSMRGRGSRKGPRLRPEGHDRESVGTVRLPRPQARR